MARVPYAARPYKTRGAGTRSSRGAEARETHVELKHAKFTSFVRADHVKLRHM
ncbi:hypothetical protein A2U01_0027949 [Trifolium medium]|uniref:Uncharacterized protein n=1 Tax=Trifolium medium TaxID=97028 RepID=A0A392P4D7_9FABA|nr:hypothetical protein [Trifolium medium]